MYMQDALFSQNRTAFNTILDSTQDFGIIVGESHTLDKMAAALSLYLALADSGKNVQVISKADPKVEVSNLVGIDKLKKNFDGLTKQFVISLPYRENEIEKISYNAEGAVLNINVVGGEGGISFSESDIKINKTGSSPSVIFTIGIESSDDISDLVEQNEDLKIVNIDNANTNVQYGDIIYVNPSFSSISEIVGKIVFESGLVLEQDTAQNLMNGIIASTGDFGATNTSPTAFEVAAYLLRHGAARQKIKLQDKKDQVRPEFQPKPKFQQPQQAQPQNQQPRPKNNQNNTAVTPTDENIPTDWFTPKVFKSSKNQE